MLTGRVRKYWISYLLAGCAAVSKQGLKWLFKKYQEIPTKNGQSYEIYRHMINSEWIWYDNDMGFSRNGGTPISWMIFFREKHEKPIKTNDLGVPPWLWNPPIWAIWSAGRAWQMTLTLLAMASTRFEADVVTYGAGLQFRSSFISCKGNSMWKKTETKPRNKKETKQKPPRVWNVYECLVSKIFSSWISINIFIFWLHISIISKGSWGSGGCSAMRYCYRWSFLRPGRRKWCEEIITGNFAPLV